MSGVVLRCPHCGTTTSNAGECAACHGGAVRYFCGNHAPGRWLDAPACPACGAVFGASAEPAAAPWELVEPTEGSTQRPNRARHAPGSRRTGADDARFRRGPLSPPPWAPEDGAPPTLEELIARSMHSRRARPMDEPPEGPGLRRRGPGPFGWILRVVFILFLLSLFFGSGLLMFAFPLLQLFFR